MSETEKPPLEQAHAILLAAMESVLSVKPLLDMAEASTDTCFATGEAASVISKAKALVGRDIDQRRGTR
jgi:hypothetical protein